MENKLVGGRADNSTIKDISKKFRVSVKYLKKQLKDGVKVESEHTDDEDKQKEIVMDHLEEYANYYEELSKMEDKLKKYWKDIDDVFFRNLIEKVRMGRNTMIE